MRTQSFVGSFGLYHSFWPCAPNSALCVSGPSALNSPPPHSRPELESTATFDTMAAMLREAGVSGALVVQPVNHAFDHRYLVAALKAHPDHRATKPIW